MDTDFSDFLWFISAKGVIRLSSVQWHTLKWKAAGCDSVQNQKKKEKKAAQRLHLFSQEGVSQDFCICVVELRCHDNLVDTADL